MTTTAPKDDVIGRRIAQAFTEHDAVLRETRAAVAPVLEAVVLAAANSLRAGGKILACGNGGSAADAQHLAAELVGRFGRVRAALPALALTTDTATLTALANDVGYQSVFARQLDALAAGGDVLFAISTSGSSPNILEAARRGRDRGCVVVGLTGQGGGRLAALVDHLVAVPSTVTARVQEMHGLCLHCVAEGLELLLRGDDDAD